MSKKKVVVSLGHEALGYTTLEQWDAVKKTAKALSDLVEADYQLTITHSNGPQVSMIHKAMTELRRVHIHRLPIQSGSPSNEAAEQTFQTRQRLLYFFAV